MPFNPLQLPSFNKSARQSPKDTNDRKPLQFEGQSIPHDVSSRSNFLSCISQVDGNGDIKLPSSITRAKFEEYINFGTSVRLDLTALPFSSVCDVLEVTRVR